MSSGTEGWLKIHRTIKESVIINTPPKCQLLWLRILLDVNHEPGHDFVGSKKVPLDPGQTLTTYQEMAGWIGASKSTVKRYLDLMGAETMVETQTKTQGKYRKTLLTVTNWGKYQSDKNKSNAKGNGNRNALSNAQSNAQSNDNSTKEVEEEKNKNNEIKDFSFQDAQKYAVKKIPSDLIEKNESYKMVGKWINDYGLEPTVKTIRDMDAKNKWDTIRESGKPAIGFIVETIKNYQEPEPDDQTDWEKKAEKHEGFTAQDLKTLAEKG